MKEEQPIFKVTDRRLFNADGTPRDIQPEAKAEQPAAEITAESSLPETPVAAREQSSATDAPPAEQPLSESSAVGAETEEDLDDEGIPDAADPAGFINFAMSIASNAASALGMMEHPVTRKREVDLELGKHWIDVLGMLQKKTTGNLTPQEAQILEGWLADLRMQFVSLNNTAAPKAAGFTGRDIIGGK